MASVTCHSLGNTRGKFVKRQMEGYAPKKKLKLDASLIAGAAWILNQYGPAPLEFSLTQKIAVSI